MEELPKKRVFRVGEVAMWYDVVDRTVYRWIQHNKLKAERTPGGQIRITRDSIIEWSKKIRRPAEFVS